MIFSGKVKSRTAPLSIGCTLYTAVTGAASFILYESDTDVPNDMDPKFWNVTSIVLSEIIFGDDTAITLKSIKSIKSVLIIMSSKTANSLLLET